MQTSARSSSTREQRIIIAVDRAIFHIARRWILVLNVISALMVGLPLIAPLLASTGHHTLANLIYRPFSLICNQLPERSFHLFGYQMALCERCFAIYGGTLILGLVYGASRRTMRPATAREASILTLPMAIDGFTQLFGWRESTWELRVITGSLFALAVAWFVFPRLQEGFDEIVRIVAERFERLVLDGRATPL